MTLILRRLLTVTLCAALILSFFTAAPVSAAGRAVLGDVNGDGATNAHDALLLFAHAAGQQRMTDLLTFPDSLDAASFNRTRFFQADVTRDGKVDTADALQVYRAVSGGHTLYTPSADELRMLELINLEREKAGVAPLAPAVCYTDCAVLRVQEQYQLFGHTRPDGTRCYTVFEELGHPLPAGGENVVKYAFSVEDAMNGLMDSPGHRDNILSPDYTAVALGIVHDELGFVTACQLFIV